MRDRLSVRALPFLLFALSGFCGLLYQVVWVRLAFARFGVITPVLSVVLSVFMAGQAVGSWAGGRWATAWTARSRHPVVWLYGVAELFIGASSLVVPWLLRAGETALLPLGTMASGRFLAWSAAILAAVLMPWCIAMGTTYPLMMAHMRSGSAPSARSFSLLYLGNVAGAVLGTALAIKMIAYVIVAPVASAFTERLPRRAVLVARTGGDGSCGTDATFRPFTG